MFVVNGGDGARDNLFAGYCRWLSPNIQVLPLLKVYKQVAHGYGSDGVRASRALVVIGNGGAN